jgi:diguanylate cyclase (GGDEF)-like protein
MGGGGAASASPYARRELPQSGHRSGAAFGMHSAAFAPTVRGVAQRPLQSALAAASTPVRVARILLAAVLAAQAVLAVLHVYTGSDILGEFVVPTVAAVLVAARVRRVRAERPAWIILVAALALLVAGNAYCVAAFADPANPPIPSLADVAYLAEYPLLFLGLGLLIRARTVGFRPSMWIDGAVAALAMGAVWTAFESPSVGAAGSIPASLVLHAYVIGDLVLGTAAVGTLAFFSWRAGGAWLAIVGAILVQSLADLLMVTVAVTPGVTEVIGLLWSVAIAAFTVAAWLPATTRSHHAVAGWRALAPTVGCSAVALGVLVSGLVGQVHLLAQVLATLAVVAGMTRLIWTANENVGLEVARRLAVTDDLTGLGNRRRLEAALRSASERSETFALLLIDLDGFKEVNDTLGHAAGDALLRAMADRLVRLVRPDDVFVRLGGDEFGVLVRGCDEAAAVSVAGGLADALEAGFEIQGITVRIGASTGIALGSGEASGAELLRRADVAMYDAKRTRTRHSVYEPETDARSPERLEAVQQLRDAMAAHAIEVHYQPKASLRSSRMYGLEALVRWRLPDGSLLSPSAFLPIAERAGLMYDLTLYVLEAALRDISWLRGRRLDLTVAVNVPPIAILDSTLARDIARLLNQAGLPANALEIEITEDSLMGDRVRARSLITGLRELGVAVSIDDYGTGYSSLPYLRDLEVDSLKLDRSFVTGLADNPKARTIVASTIHLAHALGMWVVAEGVETASDRRVLQSLDCDAAQGYLLSPPVPIGEIAQTASAWAA